MWPGVDTPNCDKFPTFARFTALESLALTEMSFYRGELDESEGLSVYRFAALLPSSIKYVSFKGAHSNVHAVLNESKQYLETEAFPRFEKFSYEMEESRDGSDDL